jgi:hypothetical protein
MNETLTCAECGLAGECECGLAYQGDGTLCACGHPDTSHGDTSGECMECADGHAMYAPSLDPIAALDREDVETAVEALRRAAMFYGTPKGLQQAAALRRVADALAEHLIDRHDA